MKSECHTTHTHTHTSYSLSFSPSLSLSLSPSLSLSLSPSSLSSRRVLDVDLESEEDEDAIIERRRQLRMAIVQKYQGGPQTEEAPSPVGSSPARSSTSSVESEAVGDRAAQDLEESIQHAADKLKMEESTSSPAPVKKNVGSSGKGEWSAKETAQLEEECTKKRTDLAAVKAAIRNGDMFTEGPDIFGEKYLVGFFSTGLRMWCQWLRVLVIFFPNSESVQRSDF